MKSKFLILVAISAVALWVAPALAITTTQTFVTPPGSTNNEGYPVNVTATFILDSVADTIEIQVYNLQSNPGDVSQCLSDIGFILSTGQTTGTLIAGASGTAIERTVYSGGSYTDVTSSTWGHWHLDTGVNYGVPGMGLKANDLGGGQPANTIIGPPNTSVSPPAYTAANTSITNSTGPHNPFFFGNAAHPVDFLLSVPGIDDTTQVTFVEFSFNTVAGDNVDAVPIPPTALLLGSGLIGLAGLGWRRKRKS
jgi:hypothetical protein